MKILGCSSVPPDIFNIMTLSFCHFHFLFHIYNNFRIHFYLHTCRWCVYTAGCIIFAALLLSPLTLTSFPPYHHQPSTTTLYPFVSPLITSSSH